MKIPFITFTAAYMTAMLFFFYTEGFLLKLIFAVSACILIFIAIITYKNKGGRCFDIFCRLFVVFLGISAAAAMSWHTAAKYENIIEKYDGKAVRVSGTVMQINKTDEYTCLTVKTDTIDDENQNIKINLVTFSENDAQLYSKILFEGKLSKLSNTSPYFDSVTYNKSFGIYFDVVTDKLEINEEKSFLLSVVSTVRNKIKLANSQSENGALLDALTVGDRGALDDGTKEIFDELGITHVLSVSGFHLVIFVMSFYSLMTHLSVQKHLCSGITVGLTVFYIAVSGFSYPVIRAGIMIIFSMAAGLFRREKDSLTGLFAVGGIITAIQSYAILNVGFQLSFCASFGIITCAVPLISAMGKSDFYQRFFYAPSFFRRIFKAVFDYITAGLFIALAASLFTYPVVLLNFYNTSLLSVISNIVFLIPFEIILILAPINIISSIVLGKAILLGVTDGIIDITFDAMRRICAVLDGSLFVNYSFMSAIACIIAVGILLMLAFKKRRFYPLMAVLVSVLVFTASLAGAAADKNMNRLTTDTKSLLFQCEGTNLIVNLTSDGESLLEYRGVGESEYDRFSLGVASGAYKGENIEIIPLYTNDRFLLYRVRAGNVEFYIFYNKRDNSYLPNIKDDMPVLIFGKKLYEYPQNFVCLPQACLAEIDLEDFTVKILSE